MAQNDSSNTKLVPIHIPRQVINKHTTMIRPILSNQNSIKSSEKQVDESPFKIKVGQFLNGLGFNIFISILTVYVLFADDFRQIFCSPSADLPFTIIIIICIVIYIAQLIFSVIAKVQISIRQPEYVLNFFFWLDLISLGTMVFDMMWINVGGAAGVAANIVQITRAGKATRIGARSARIIRIVKLMKNIQQYKTAKQQINNQGPKPLQGMIDNLKKNDTTSRRRQAIIQPTTNASHPNFQQNFNQQIIQKDQLKISTKDLRVGTYSQFDDVKQTRVSLKLKQAMQITVTTIIILLLLSVPLLSSSTWFQQTPVYKSSIRQLQYFMKKGLDNYTIDFHIQTFINQSQLLYNPIVYLKYIRNQTCCQFPKDYEKFNQNVPDLDDLRASSTITQQFNNIIVVYNTTSNDILTSQLNVGRTLFVCILLILSSLFLAQDIEDYILQPLDSMLITVKRISADPLKAMISIQNEKLIKSTIENWKQWQDQRKLNQPAILQDMMMKIGSLLVVGFGQAGSQIIVKNIEMTQGAINPVLSGTKMIAIFGFCDIRNFTDATQVLQTGVMNFVNDVAQIVHSITHKYGGSANKNIGDAFLLVWKFKQKQVFLSENNGKTQVTLRRIKKVSQMTDLAVYSYMKIIAQLTKTNQLKKYSNDKRLQSRINNYTGVKMGFGLHVGWAIQGAIGSKLKIDASYLSPNVNMASRLEAATKQFGVLTLFSGQIVQLMTPNNKKLMRQIDRVTVKGSKQPIDLFTLDLHPHLLITKDTNQYIPIVKINSIMQKKKNKMFTHKTRQLILSSIQQGKNITDRMFTTDNDFFVMRQLFTTQFFSNWSKGFQLYIQGQWAEAKQYFIKTQSQNGFKDGPSTTMIQIIQANDECANDSWQGFRQLTQK